MTRPIQNAEKLPATRPESTFNDAPPWSEALATSWTCRDLVLTNILVNCMMSAAASVPHATMAGITHQRLGSGTSLVTPSTVCEMLKSPSNNLLAMKQVMMETP